MSMKTHTSVHQRFVLTAVAVFGLAISQAFAALLVITDPVVNTGTNAINNYNRTLVSAAGATSEATLEALSGFAGIPSFAFAGNQTVTNQYIFDFTTGGKPDIRLRYMGNATNFLTTTAVHLTNSTFSTSISNSMRLGIGGTNRLFTFRIDAGTYAAGTFTADQGLSALGFTLCSGTTATAVPITINYCDSLNNVLSAQTVYSPTSGTGYRYTGYQSSGATKIAYAEISYTTVGYAAPTLSMDDLSFTVIPEPATAGLFFGAGVVALILRRTIVRRD